MKDERRKKDQLDSFIDQNGFHLRGKGQREGIIYYIENFKVCEIGFEMSGDEKYNIIINMNFVNTWSLLEEILLTNPEKDKIAEGLKLWLVERQIRALIY